MNTVVGDRRAGQPTPRGRERARGADERVARRYRHRVVCALLVALAVAAFLLSLAYGTYQLSLGQVLGALTGSEQGLVRDIVVDWRLPRALGAVGFGAALGASGAVFQAMTRNPLASPDIVGFAAGSYTGALLVIIMVGGSFGYVATGALAGGLATAVLIYLLAYRQGVQGFRLIVVGVGVSVMLTSLNTWMLLVTDPDTALAGALWNAGRLNLMSWEHVALTGPVVALLFLALAALAPSLRQLELGDELARSHGVRIEPVRLALTVVGVALTAVVTAAAGPIGFVALVAPQVARMLVRAPGISLAAAACLGAALLSWADFLAAHGLGVDMPVGVVTTVLGGGYLAWLLLRERIPRS